MYGPLNRNQVIQPRMLHEREPQSLDRLVQELYSVEDFGLRTSNIELDSDDNYQFRKIVEDTTKKISEELIVLARIPMMMSPDEVQRVSPTTWYLQHFTAVNPHNPKKLRIEFDAAANAPNVQEMF
ncbi:unnamed protein product [Ceratitis capitata]|uniref:(Mediterranean fruit fly) hypothetical protein n=1 Tax=Ceratitis capitata TaxID=7213 RepID=A0A811USN9_CERCA|nr:unnamed protein product [Ceratitis capitata]CAD7001716.1 unnamed protein product [Ceratitis capitata]